MTYIPPHARGLGSETNNMRKLMMDQINMSTLGNINITGGSSSGTSSIFGELFGQALNIGGMVALGCLAGRSGSAGVSTGKVSEQVSTTSTVLMNFVKADDNLDTAKTNMSNAMSELGDLQKELKAAEKAQKNEGGPGTVKYEQAQLDELNEKSSVTPEQAKAYETAKANYETAQQYSAEFTGLKKEAPLLINQLTPIINTQTAHGKAIFVTGYVENGTAKATAITGGLSDIVGSGGLQLEGGSAVRTLETNNGNKAYFYTVDKHGKNETVYSPAEFANAMKTATALDAEFKQREAIANSFNETSEKLVQNLKRQNELRALCNNQDPNGYKRDCEVEMDNAAKYGKVSSYVAQLDAHNDKIAELEKLGSEDNIASLKAAIQAKETEIAGKLKTELDTAQKAYDAAEKEVKSMKENTDNMATLDSNLASAKTAAKASRKHNLWNGFGLFSKKTDDEKFYKERKKENKTIASQYQQVYGGSYQDINKLISDAYAEANKKNVDLKDDYKNVRGKPNPDPKATS